MSEYLVSERIGKSNVNTYGTLMTIIEYKNKDNIKVKFEDGFIKNSNYTNFISGKIKSVFNKSVYGVGFIGTGMYKESIYNETTAQYKAWKSMMKRCYSDNFHEQRPTYIDCSVCEEWHNFQNFAKWYDDNFYQIDNEKMCLDKDILIKGNKIYSPDTCVFVPNTINTLFIKNNNGRGILPIGVNYQKDKGKYRSYCLVKSKQKFLGRFDNPQLAFIAYKNFKEKHIKSIADEYKNKIPQNLYDAMYKYEIEITD